MRSIVPLFFGTLVGVGIALLGVEAANQNSALFQSTGGSLVPAVAQVQSSHFLMTGSVDTFVGFGSSTSFQIQNSNIGASSTIPIRSSATTTATSTPSASTSGGNSGGGAGLSSPVTNGAGLLVSGLAFPQAAVSLLRNGVIMTNTTANGSGSFVFTLANIASGTSTWAIQVKDSHGIYSPLYTFTVPLLVGQETVVSGIFAAPTIQGPPSGIVKRGDVTTISGYTAPGSDVILTLTSPSGAVSTFSVRADASGKYLYTLPTASLSLGTYFLKAQSILGRLMSGVSAVLAMTISSTAPSNVSSAICYRADVNCDGRVDLVDISIVAFWYKHPLDAAFRFIETGQLSGDGRVDLTDFSILAFYWTG